MSFSKWVMLAAVLIFAGCSGSEFDVKEDLFPPGQQDAASDARDAKPDIEAEARAEADAPDAAPDVVSEADASEVDSEVVDAAEEQSEDASPDVQPDVAQDTLPEAQPDSPTEASLDAPMDSPAEAQPDAPPDGLQPEDCELLGTNGRITVIVRHQVDQPKVLAILGRLTYNDLTQNTGFSTWCWGEPSATELACMPPDKNGQPAHPVSGMNVRFAPGQTMDGSQLGDGDLFCSLQACLEGDYLVCDGKNLICRVNQGVKTGPVSYVLNTWGKQDIVCSIP